jgi:hypothetical protein
MPGWVRGEIAFFPERARQFDVATLGRKGQVLRVVQAALSEFLGMEVT